MKILIIILFLAQTTFGQINYMQVGNKFINQNNYVDAENTFREAIKSDNNNLEYKCQLALSLSRQKKNDEAEKYIQEVLKVDSLQVAALFYGGVNSFTATNSNFRKAVEYFEKAFPLIQKESGQYFAINFFIGKSYKNLLITEGLSFNETNRMLETLREYVRLQPNASDANEIQSFVEYVETKRPSANVKKWVLTNSEEKVTEMIKKQIQEK
jgi:tetratricopeptide (TPR) repeat protein